jgi:hypothetical protein
MRATLVSAPMQARALLRARARECCSAKAVAHHARGSRARSAAESVAHRALAQACVGSTAAMNMAEQARIPALESMM